MRRILGLLAVSFMIASCGPSAYLMMLDKREPSPSGLELAGKSLSIIYLESPDGVDSLFNNRISDILALGLEDEYFGGERAVDVRRLVKDAEGDYKSKETLAGYVMDLGSDVVMVVDVPEVIGLDASGKQQARTMVYAYDSMGRDSVTVLSSRYKVDSFQEVSKALSIGSSLLAPLKSEWGTEEFQFVYYDGGRRWYDALGHAENFEWDKAIQVWMDLLPSLAPQAQSCAMYNIATACFIAGEYGLSKEWLERSEATFPISLSKSLSSRLTAKGGK